MVLYCMTTTMNGLRHTETKGGFTYKMEKRKYTLNAKCPRCGEYMLLSPIDDYCLYCHNCEEDFYSFEVSDIVGDYFEIRIDINISEYKTMLEDIKENFQDTCFIGYDDVIGVCDIGFKNIPNCQRIKDIIKYFNLIEV